MSVPRDWDAAVREAKSAPVRFVLGGVTFNVPAPIRAIAFLDFADKQTTVGTDLVASFRDLLLEIIDPTQRPLVNTAIRDSGISGQLLVDLVKWLIEEATARPTERHSGSPPSASANGARTSRGASPSGGVRRRPRTASG